MKSPVWSTVQFVFIYVIYIYVTTKIVELFANGHIGLLPCCLIANTMWIFLFYAGCLWNVDVLRALFPKGDV